MYEHTIQIWHSFKFWHGLDTWYRIKIWPLFLNGSSKNLQINPQLCVWIWHLMVQFQSDPFYFTQVIIHKSENNTCFWPLNVALILGWFKSQSPKSIRLPLAPFCKIQIRSIHFAQIVIQMLVLVPFLVSKLYKCLF